MLLWLGMGGAALAASSPTEAVQRFVESVRQGRFAEAQTYLLSHVDVGSSLFGSWLFNNGAAGNAAATADIFFSRKFAEAFRYTIIDAANNGDSQAFVTATRTTPHMNHLYTWALAPQRNALPYTLVGAIDSYLTQVNYPVEESQMQFTLVRELDKWYISAIYDEKFKVLREQIIAQPPLSSVSAVVPAAPQAAASGAAASAAAGAAAAGSTVRQTADAQFQATMQGLNKAPQAAAAPAVPEKKPGLFARVGRVFGLGKKKQQDDLLAPRPSAPAGATSTGAVAAGAVTAGAVATGAVAAAPPAPSPPSDAELRRRLQLIRDALATYVGTNSSVPTDVTIYDWKTLREVVNFYGKRELPASEQQAGFRFVQYRANGIDDYTLLVQVDLPDASQRQLEVTPYGVEANN